MGAELFTPSEGIYLLSHSIGKLPLSSRKVLDDSVFAPWARADADVWPHWLQAINGFRQALSVLFSRPPGEFCPQSNVSDGFSKLLSGLKIQGQRRVFLFSERDFPSLGFCLEQAQRFGFEPRCLPADHAPCDLNRWSEALTDDVAAVLLSHVQYETSTQLPIAEITAMARQKRIFSVVDVAQSAGVVPIDFNRWQADAVVGSCIKWLCGGPGAGFLWMTDAVAGTMAPADVGWFSHRNPFEFDIHHFEYASSVARFWGGTPSVSPFVLAANGIRTLNAIGIETVRDHNLTLGRRLLEALPADWMLTPMSDAERGGTLAIAPPNATEVMAALRQAGVHCDQRGRGIRLSPHIYNGVDDIDEVISVFRQVAHNSQDS